MIRFHLRSQKFLREKIIRAERVLDNQQMIIRQLMRQICKGQQGMTKKELNRFVNKVATAAVYKLYNPMYEVDMEAQTVKETWHL